MTDDHTAVLRQVRLAQRDGNTAEPVRAVRRLADVTDLLAVDLTEGHKVSNAARW